MAYSSSECACDADWTPQEVYDLKAENKRLREALEKIRSADYLFTCDNFAIGKPADMALRDIKKIVKEALRNEYTGEKK